MSEWIELKDLQAVALAQAEGWEIQFSTEGAYWYLWGETEWVKHWQFRGRPKQPKIKKIKMLCYLSSGRLTWIDADVVPYKASRIRVPAQDIEIEVEMTDDLVKRLRDENVTGFNLTVAAVEAAERIEELERELEIRGGVLELHRIRVAELEGAERQRDELLDTLKFARDEVAIWGMYAAEYFRKKYDLGRSIDRIDAAIAAAQKEPK